MTRGPIKTRDDAISMFTMTKQLLSDAQDTHQKCRDLICEAINEGLVEAPFKVGSCQPVKYRKDKKMIVEEIWVRPSYGTNEIEIHGRGPILKKNRQPSKNYGVCAGVL